MYEFRDAKKGGKIGWLKQSAALVEENAHCVTGSQELVNRVQIMDIFLTLFAVTKMRINKSVALEMKPL